VGRVFRDEEELAASPHLSREIREALDRSEWLIVVCSPRTPASRWIAAEVEHFRARGRGDRIRSLLVEGEPGESFPVPLLAIDAPAEATPGMDEAPLAADVRGAGAPLRRMAEAPARTIAARRADPWPALRRAPRARGGAPQPSARRLGAPSHAGGRRCRLPGHASRLGQQGPGRGQ
jgi:hypothetical protein